MPVYSALLHQRLSGKALPQFCFSCSSTLFCTDGNTPSAQNEYQAQRALQRNGMVSGSTMVGVRPLDQISFEPKSYELLSAAWRTE